MLFSNRSASHFNLQDYALALEDGEKSLQLRPDWPKAHLRCAMPLLYLGRYAEARDRVKKGLAIDPAYPSLLECGRQIDERERAYNAAIEAQVRKEREEREREERERANAAFSAAPVQHVPVEEANRDRVARLKERGGEAYGRGDYNEAVRLYTEALGLDPSNHLLYSNRSAAFAVLGEYSSALDDALATVQLKPEWEKGYSRLGLAYANLNRISEAKAAYQKGLSLDPNNELLLEGLARCEELSREPEETQGTRTWPDGRTYTGTFIGNNIEGVGTCTWPDGSKYAGDFKNGVKHGAGIFTWPAGHKYQGEYK